MAEEQNNMAFSGLREVTKAKMPRSKRAPRNETYKESLLRRIASGDPSSSTVAQPPVAPKASPSTMRSANSSASAASQDLEKVLPANNMASDLERDAVNNPSTAAKSPKIELKFSKIVSMALLVGPDLKSRVTTSSSAKPCVSQIARINSKPRMIQPATTFRSALIPTNSSSARSTPMKVVTINSKRTSGLITIPMTEKKACENSSDLESAPITSSSTKNTSVEVSKVNDKKRKIESTTPSKPAKKARKSPPVAVPDKSPFQLNANKRNTSKNPDLDDPVDLTTPTRRKPSSVRKPKKPP